MEISEHIIIEAKEILQNNQYSLPAQISSAPLFFVAEANDDSIQTFHVIKHDGTFYQIGTKR